MSDSVRSHRWQPTRLCHPWDSPGKNTGVGCHFLLQCMKVKSESEVTKSCPILCDPMDCSTPGSSIHGIFQARVLEWGAVAFSCFRCRVRLFIWLFSCFLRYACIAMNFPLSTVLQCPTGFGLLCFHFHSFLCIFWLLFWFLLWFVDYSEACCSASTCWNF